MYAYNIYNIYIYIYIYIYIRGFGWNFGRLACQGLFEFVAKLCFNSVAIPLFLSTKVFIWIKFNNFIFFC